MPPLGCTWGGMDEEPQGRVRGRVWAGDAVGNTGWKGASLDSPQFSGLAFFPVFQGFHPFQAGGQRGDST